MIVPEEDEFSSQASAGLLYLELVEDVAERPGSSQSPNFQSQERLCSLLRLAGDDAGGYVNTVFSFGDDYDDRKLIADTAELQQDSIFTSPIKPKPAAQITVVSLLELEDRSTSARLPSRSGLDVWGQDRCHLPTSIIHRWNLTYRLSCPQCGMGFNYISEVKTHMVKVHIVVQCALCQESVNSTKFFKHTRNQHSLAPSQYLKLQEKGYTSSRASKVQPDLFYD